MTVFLLPPPLQLVGVYAAALLMTLAFASACTPRAWWKRANGRALLVLAAGTWAIGSLLLWLGDSNPPATATADNKLPAMAAPLRPAAVQATQAPLAGQVFLAYRDLNLRAGAAVSAPRLLVVPGGATVHATGKRQGDWWQVASDAAGQQQTGWASSLWLRRGDEATHP